MKYTIYVNDNTPCRERRPTYLDDLDQDIWQMDIEVKNDEEAYQKAFLYCNGFRTVESFKDACGLSDEEIQNFDYKAEIENCDWGFGDPFVFKIDRNNGTRLFDEADIQDFYNEVESY